jgi:hypothetical protein
MNFATKRQNFGIIKSLRKVTNNNIRGAFDAPLPVYDEITHKIRSVPNPRKQLLVSVWMPMDVQAKVKESIQLVLQCNSQVIV